MCVVSINVPEEILLDLYEDQDDGVSVFSFDSDSEFLEELGNA